MSVQLRCLLLGCDCSTAAPSGAKHTAPTRSRYASQPANTKEGLTAALGSLSRGVRQAANTIVAIPMREYHRTGAQVVWGNLDGVWRLEMGWGGRGEKHSGQSACQLCAKL